MISINMKMSTEGLPLNRQEHGFDDNNNNDDYDEGILAGEDFLSILMGSTFKSNYHEESSLSFLTTTTPTTESTTDSEYNRETRSLPQQTEVNISLDNTTISDNNNNNNNNNNSSNNNNKYSDNSSVDRTLIEDDNVSTTQSQDNEEDVTAATSTDELPSLIAESNKHNFGVEETEPITLKSDLIPIEFDSSNNNNNDDNDSNNGEDYPARIQPLEPNQFHHHHHHHHQQSTSSFITQQYENDKDKIHQTVIFHDDPNNTGRARSVSYSTVIQALPNTHFNKNQQEVEQQQHREEVDEAQQQSRHERHYDTDQSLFNRNFDGNIEKLENNTNYQRTTIATTLSTTTPPTTTTIKSLTTERNWGRLPIIYNMPEQNYEIDESVSVMTNGRVHGIQTTTPHTPLSTITQQQQMKNDNNNRNVSNNNKIGYVVQGRNYRKYRVEERTSDGFIVGEYGVVSNNDGTLRGVRYTADGTISRRLIQDALMKFLSL